MFTSSNLWNENNFIQALLILIILFGLFDFSLRNWITHCWLCQCGKKRLVLTSKQELTDLGELSTWWVERVHGTQEWSPLPSSLKENRACLKHNYLRGLLRRAIINISLMFYWAYSLFVFISCVLGLCINSPERRTSQNKISKSYSDLIEIPTSYSQT